MPAVIDADVKCLFYILMIKTKLFLLHELKLFFVVNVWINAHYFLFHNTIKHLYGFLCALVFGKMINSKS